MKHDPWWKQPVTCLLWREIRAHGRTRRELVALQDSVAELVAGSEALCRSVDRWQMRCVALETQAEVLRDIADPERKAMVTDVLDSIDWLGER